MYLSIAMASLLYLMIEIKRTVGIVVIALLTFFLFVITVYFNSSRAGILTFFSVAVVGIGFVIVKFKSWFVRIPMLAIVFFILFILFNSNYRYKKMLHGLGIIAPDTTTTISTNIDRLDIWKYTLADGGWKFLGGVGIGDAQSFLNQVYLKYNLTSWADANQNTHNQYLETLLAIGIPGFFLLLIILLVPLWGIPSNRFLFLSLILAVVINMCFESILEKQSGVLFFSLFYSILLFQAKNTNNASVSDE